MKLNKRDKIIYTAALLEGEGYFGLKEVKNKKYPIIVCFMADKDIIDRLHNWWGGNYSIREKKEGVKKQYGWRLASYEIIKPLCEKILPFMGERRSKVIKQMLECKSYKRMSKMKKRNEEIRKLYKNGMYQKDISKKYNLSAATISDIVNNKSRF